MPDPAPFVTREALEAFIQLLVEQFSPKQVILFGSQARGEARWDEVHAPVRKHYRFG